MCLQNTFEFFLNCQIWHFCHSCTNLTSWGFKISKKIIASTGYWTHNTNPTIKIPAPLPTQPICQSMPVSNFQTLLKSCSIEPEMIQVQFKDILFNKCLGGRVVKGAGILIVGLVLWVQYPVEAIFFADFETRDVNFVQEWQKCQIWQLRKNTNVSNCNYNVTDQESFIHLLFWRCNIFQEINFIKSPTYSF